MKIWMQDTQSKKNRTPIYIWAGIAGIAVLAAGMTAAAAVLTICAKEEYKAAVSLAMCLLTVVTVITFSAKMGCRLMIASIIFFQDESGRLYVLDIRDMIRYRKGLFGMAAMLTEIRNLIPRIRQQAEQEKSVPPSALEILSADKITERSDSYSLLCQVRYPNGQMGNTAMTFAKGYEDEDALLFMLERKLRWRASFEPEKRYSPAGILISLIAVILFSAICVFSHPNFNRLPQTVYFPCLGADTAAIWVMIYFIIRYRRGK